MSKKIVKKRKTRKINKNSQITKRIINKKTKKLIGGLPIPELLEEKMIEYFDKFIQKKIDNKTIKLIKIPSSKEEKINYVFDLLNRLTTRDLKDGLDKGIINHNKIITLVRKFNTDEGRQQLRKRYLKNLNTIVPPLAQVTPIAPVETPIVPPLAQVAPVAPEPVESVATPEPLSNNNNITNLLNEINKDSAFRVEDFIDRLKAQPSSSENNIYLQNNINNFYNQLFIKYPKLGSIEINEENKQFIRKLKNYIIQLKLNEIDIKKLIKIPISIDETKKPEDNYIYKIKVNNFIKLLKYFTSDKYFIDIFISNFDHNSDQTYDSDFKRFESILEDITNYTNINNNNNNNETEIKDKLKVFINAPLNYNKLLQIYYTKENFRANDTFVTNLSKYLNIQQQSSNPEDLYANLGNRNQIGERLKRPSSNGSQENSYLELSENSEPPIYENMTTSAAVAVANNQAASDVDVAGANNQAAPDVDVAGATAGLLATAAGGGKLKKTKKNIIKTRKNKTKLKHKK